MSESNPSTELDELKESQKTLRQYVEELATDLNAPLTITSEGKVNSGVLWLTGNWATDFWSKARNAPKPNKCICQACGNKHVLKGARP